MMDYKEYLILTDVPTAYVPEDYRAVVLQGEHTDGRTKVMVTHTENPLLAGDTLVYGFNPYTGEKTEPFDEALYTEIRPLGNSPDGLATGYLGFDTWAGAAPRLCGDESSPDAMARLFPGTPPFDAEARHKYFDLPATPAATGWGFRVELVGSYETRDPTARAIGSYETRDPTARAIGVYSDPECTAFLWTTGAFVRGPSDWQVDEDPQPLLDENGEPVLDDEGMPVMVAGQPLEVWYTDSWDGDRPDEQKDWHIAFLLGSAQEGHQTLPVGSDGIRYLFWDQNQPEPPGGSEWVDTGATVIAQAGTLYRISDIGIAASLTTGQQIRFGDTAETTFTGTWAGGGDYLEIDPFVQATVGDALWSFE